MNRLRGTLLSMFPALERSLDVTNTGPLRGLTGYQAPAVIRRAGIARLTKWLANRKVRNAGALAEVAVEAAEWPHTVIPGEKTIAKLVPTLAEEVMALIEQIREIQARRGPVSRVRPRRHPPERPRHRRHPRRRIPHRHRRRPGRVRLPGRVGGLR